MYEERSKVIRLVVLFVGFIFLLRLFYVQVIDEQYKIFADNNALRKKTIIPVRGLILDRHGKPVVTNETMYDVMVIPNKVLPFDTTALCKVLEVNKNEFLESLDDAQTFSRHQPSPVVKNISLATYGKLQERLFEFSGFFVQARASRSYPEPVAAHLLGYLSEVNKSDIEKADGYYTVGDYMGRTGLERSYEKELRGTKGIKTVVVDVLNREKGSYLKGKFDRAAVAGKDITTGLDLELQAYGEKLMEGRKGSIIAIEPSTGEILALISMPTYDPNMLLGRERSGNIARLSVDPEKPMFNRAISARYPPGSTFKPLMALIGQKEGVITPNTTFTCVGGYHLTATKTIRCHSSGTFNLEQAIMMSCNNYFCNVFRVVMDQARYRTPATGLDNWSNDLYAFGLGHTLGLDIPNENKGFIPTSKTYNRAYGQNRWHSSTIISLGIGQAELGFTPLQMANVAATIANRGFYITPHFVRSMERHGTLETLKWEKHSTGMDDKYFDIVQQGMQDVVEHGTGLMARVAGMTICGKTGTAQNPHGEDHSLFVAFSPRVNPKIAICVVVENAGQGGAWAAPIASLMMEKYINDSIVNKWSEKRVLDANALILSGAAKENIGAELKKDVKEPLNAPEIPVKKQATPIDSTLIHDNDDSEEPEHQ